MRAISDFKAVELFENTASPDTTTTDKLSSKKTGGSHYFMQILSSTCDQP